MCVGEPLLNENISLENIKQQHQSVTVDMNLFYLIKTNYVQLNINEVFNKINYVH